MRRIHCAGWQPISASVHDTTETKQEVHAHDCYGVVAGCWTKPSGAVCRR